MPYYIESILIDTLCRFRASPYYVAKEGVDREALLHLSRVTLRPLDSLDLVFDASRVKVLDSRLLLVAETSGGGVSTSSGGLDLSLDLSVLDTESSSILVPDVDGPASNVDEAGDGDPEGDSGVPVVRDGTLDRGQDGTTGDTHDDHGGGSSSVSTETSGSEDEDDGVHDRLEEHDDDAEVDTGRSVDGGDHDGEDGAADGVDTEQDRSSDESEETDTDESTDSEANETVGEVSR